MPNDVINGAAIPLPNADSFDTLNDLINAVKAYSREAGFSIVIVDKQSQTSRILRCTKSHEQKSLNASDLNPEDDGDI